MDVMPGCFIHEVDAYKYPGNQLDGLENQVEIPLQAGGVADDDGCVCPAGAEEVPGLFFFGGMRHKGIGSGEIGKYVVMASAVAEAQSVFHGFARPVAGVLFHSGEAVEKGAFAYVGIAGQGNGFVAGGRLFDEDFFPFCRADGDDGAADEIGAGVAGRAFSYALDEGLVYKSEI